MELLILPTFALIIIAYLILLTVLKRSEHVGKSKYRKGQFLIFSSVLMLISYFLPWIEYNFIVKISLNAFELRKIHQHFMFTVFATLIPVVILLVSGIIQLIKPIKSWWLFHLIEFGVVIIPMFFMFLISRDINISNRLMSGAMNLGMGASTSYGYMLFFGLLIITFLYLVFLRIESFINKKNHSN